MLFSTIYTRKSIWDLLFFFSQKLLLKVTNMHHNPLASEEVSQVPHTYVIWFDRLDTQEELRDIVEHAPRKRVVIFTSGVLQVIVSFVVEHFVGGQVHCRIQKLTHFFYPN